MGNWNHKSKIFKLSTWSVINFTLLTILWPALSAHSSHLLEGQVSTSQCTCAEKKNKNSFLCQELKPCLKLDYCSTKLLTSDTKQSNGTKIQNQWTYTLPVVLKSQRKHINRGYSYSCALASGHSKYHLCNVWRCRHKEKYASPTSGSQCIQSKQTIRKSQILQHVKWLTNSVLGHRHPLLTSSCLQHPFPYDALNNFVGHLIWPVTNYTDTHIYLCNFRLT